MSLFEKSNQNLKATELLIQKGYFNTSIHAAYYAVYQILILINKKVGASTIHINDKQNSHINTINHFKQKFKEHQNINKITSSLHTIRKKRTEADYQDKLIEKEEAERIYNMSKRLREQLIDLYKK